jgi:hypothetical protein
MRLRNIINSVIQVYWSKSALNSINYNLIGLLGLAARFGILYSSRMGFSFEQQLAPIRHLLGL